MFLKNLLFLFLVAVASAHASDYAFVTRSSDTPHDVPFRIEVNGDTVSAYTTMPLLWKATLSKDFPRECLTKAQENAGKPVPCGPTEKVLRKHFDPETFAVVDTVKKTRHTITLTSAGATAESHPATPVVRKDLPATIMMTWIVAIGIGIASLANGWMRVNRKYLFMSYGAVLGAVIAGGFAGTLVGSSVNGFAGVLVGVLVGGLVGGLASVFAGELAGGFAGTLVGSSVNGFAGVLAGMLAGMLAGQYGWSGAGITEYLVFLGLVCAASFLLREVVALARKRMRKPDAAMETIET